MAWQKRSSVLKWICIFLLAVAVLLAVCWRANTVVKAPAPSSESTVETVQQTTKKPETAQETVQAYASAHGIAYDAYPESLIDLLSRNKETKEFVLEYPIEKDKKHKIDLSEYENCTSVPLFLQWDKRWGYKMYGDDVAGLTGCGPVCLSMAAVYLLQDTKYSPDWMLDFAIKNGYCVEGHGSLWTLIDRGGAQLGLDVQELPLSKEQMVSNLKQGYPIICIMGPGDFTQKGHFIVLTGYEDGKITLNDPNSRIRSEKKWKYSELKDQIQNLWVLRKK